MPHPISSSPIHLLCRHRLLRTAFITMALCVGSFTQALERTAGHAGSGSANSPGGSMLPTPLGPAPLRLGGESNLLTCMIDGIAGYGYSGTSDGRLVMWSMGTGTTPPVRIGAISLGSTAISCAVADLPARQLYVCAGSRLYQVALGQGSALPQLQHTLTLPSAPAAIALDAARGQLYLANSNGLHKVSRGTAAVAPQILASLNSSISGIVKCCLLHPTRAEVLLATDASPARVVKFALGTTTATPTLVGDIALATDENAVACGVLDAAGDYAYLGTRTVPGRVVKIAFNAAAQPPTRTHALVLPTGEDQLTVAMANPSTGHVWFGTTSVYRSTDTLPAKLIKVGMVAGSGAPIRIAAETMPLGIHEFGSMMIDTVRQQAWLGTVDPGRVVKCSLGAGITAPAYIAHTTLDSLEASLSALAIDEARGYAYAAMGWDQDFYYSNGYGPGRVVKLRLGGANDPPRRVSELQLLAHEPPAMGAAVDSARGFLYILTYHQLIKARLGEGDAPIERVATLTVPNVWFTAAGFDFESGYAWLPDDAGRLNKVALGEGDDAPTHLGFASTPNIGYAAWNRILIDPLRKRGYCWTASTSNYHNTRNLYKFNLGNGAELPGYLNRMQFSAQKPMDGVIDIPNNTAYFDFTASLQKVNLGMGDTPPTQVGSAYISVPLEWAMLSFNQSARRVIKTRVGYAQSSLIQEDIGNSISSPSYYGYLSLPNFCTVIALDPSRQDIYAHLPTLGLYKFTTGHYDVLRLAKIKLQATGELVRVGMQVHRGGGHARLALYRTQPDGTHTLAWESQATTVTTGTSLLEIPVAAGVPASAVLAAGDYLLGVQLDHPTATLAYVGTAPSGQSAYLLRSFGPAPATLGAAGQADAPIPTSDLWSAYFITRGGTGVESRIWTAYDEAPIPSSSLAP